jgi:hypothetical protein
MSHPSCPVQDASGDEAEDGPSGGAPAGNDVASDLELVASYDCINDCVASQGLPGIAAATIAGAACTALSGGACALVLYSSAVAFLTACNDACLELESP